MAKFSKKLTRKTLVGFSIVILVLVLIGLFGSVITNIAEANEGDVGQVGTGDNEPSSECDESWNPLKFLSLACLVVRINSLIAYAVGFIIMLVMMILEYSLYLNSKIFELPAVQVGWNFTRDIANMGFVLGIIVIAFATILRRQSYGVKQLLVKLIIAAVFVNLSLSIAGVFLDLAGVPTQFFIDKISSGTGGATAFSTTMAGAFNLQNINEINKNTNRDSGIVANLMKAIASVLFTLVFSLVILITLIAMVGMFLYRFMVLAILVILMPLAILAWIFPILHSNWSKWLTTFFKWTFFAPLALFFLYLAVYSIEVQGNYLTLAAQTLKVEPLNPALAIEANIMVGTNDATLLIANMVLMILLTMGGLFAAQSMSIVGASAALGMATSWSKALVTGATVKPVAALGGVAARSAGRYALRAGAQPEAGKASWAQRGATRLASIPVLRGLAKYVGKAEKSREKRVADIQSGEMANLSNDSLEKFLKSGTIFSNLERAAAAFAEAAKRKDKDGNNLVSKLEAADKDQYNKFIGAARSTGTLKEISKYKPEAAEPSGPVVAKTGETEEHAQARAKFEAVQKVTRTMGGRKIAEDVDVNSFGDTNFVLSIEDNQLKGIDEFASPDKIKAFMETINNLEIQKGAGTLSKLMEDRLNDLTDAINTRMLFQRYAKKPTIIVTP